MAADRSRRRFERAWFRAIAWACGLLLTVGTVPVHGGGLEGHVDTLGSVSDETVFACVDDHPLAPHVEAARPLQRTACPACLQRLQQRAWLAAADRLAEPLELEDPAHPAADPFAPRSVAELPAPRGPPPA